MPRFFDPAHLDAESLCVAWGALRLTAGQAHRLSGAPLFQEYLQDAKFQMTEDLQPANAVHLWLWEHRDEEALFNLSMLPKFGSRAQPFVSLHFFPSFGCICCQLGKVASRAVSNLKASGYTVAFTTTAPKLAAALSPENATEEHWATFKEGVKVHERVRARPSPKKGICAQHSEEAHHKWKEGDTESATRLYRNAFVCDPKHCPLVCRVTEIWYMVLIPGDQRTLAAPFTANHE